VFVDIEPSGCQSTGLGGGLADVVEVDVELVSEYVRSVDEQPDPIEPLLVCRRHYP